MAVGVVEEINMDELKIPKFKINTDAFDELNAALINFGEVAAKAVSDLAIGITKRLCDMPPQMYHQMGLKHPDEIRRDYYLYTAEPDEVVDYIVSQPNHTWNGVTIYPDEVWRYRCKADWMWWRLA